MKILKKNLKYIFQNIYIYAIIRIIEYTIEKIKKKYIFKI